LNSAIIQSMPCSEFSTAAEQQNKKISGKSTTGMKKEVELPKKTAERIKMREKKKQPKMKVSGKSVFKLKGLIIKN